MLSSFKREALQEQVLYYNNDAGFDLGDNAPVRAVYANVAWCLVDKDRFFQYYEKSPFWAVQLHSAARLFGFKPSLLARQPFGNSEYKKLRWLIYDYLCENVGRKFILRPHNLDIAFDEHSVYVMLVQAYEREF